MTDILDGSVIRMFRLTNEPGGLGLNCSSAGLFLAGVPLLRKTPAGFTPRPVSEIASLMNAAYGADSGSPRLQSSLGAIAQALNRGDFAAAIIAAVHTQTPELSTPAAMRRIHVDEELTKYNYNPDEPRDRHGRWTRDGTDNQTRGAAPGIASDQAVDAQVQHPRIAKNAPLTDTTPVSNVGDGDKSNDERK